MGPLSKQALPRTVVGAADASYTPLPVIYLDTYYQLSVSYLMEE